MRRIALLTLAAALCACAAQPRPCTYYYMDPREHGFCDMRASTARLY